jgi:hypothetical protein
VNTFSLAANPAGDAVALWDGDGAINSAIVMSASKLAGQGWPATNSNTQLSPLGLNGFDGVAGASRTGSFLVVWELEDGTSPNDGQAVFRPGGAAPWGSSVLLGDLDGLTPGEPALGIGPRGDAAVAFPAGISPKREHVALGDGGDPPALSLVLPTNAATDRPASFGFDATDFTGIASSSLNFGDGATLRARSLRAATGSQAHTYRTPGTYTVTAAATDARGHSSSTSKTLVVKDATAPVITRLSLSRKRFAVARKRTPVSARRRKARKGSSIRFRLSERARTTLTIQLRTRGFRKGRRCVGRRPRGKKRARRCTRFVKKGALRRRSRAGKNTVAFSGRIGRRALRRGRYRLVAVAKDAAGNRSKARRASFQVVRR